jgi:hypothetical protein
MEKENRVKNLAHISQKNYLKDHKKYGIYERNVGSNCN